MTKQFLMPGVLRALCFLSIGINHLAGKDHLPVIDTHVHLWHLDRPEGIYWIKKDDAALYRSFLPEDYEVIAKANGVDGVVVVQAGQHLPDNQWNLDITAHNKTLFRGVVGNLSQVIGSEKFQPLFDQLCQDKRYLGYRLSGREGGELSEEFFRNLEMTARRGKTVDFLIGKYSFDDVATIAKRVPNLKIILDHFGNIVLDGKPLDPAWVKKYRTVARHPNVFCKVSALFGRVKKQPAPQDPKYYEEILDLSFECFGEDRLVFGSDWPVTRTSGDYASVLKLTRAYFDQKGEGVSKKLFSENAEEFYGVRSRKIEKGDKVLPLPGKAFRVNGRDAFMILPENAGVETPWVWYAPTLQGLPAQSEVWMFERFLAKGIAIAGIDVGESYGSPDGRKCFSDLYDYLVEERGFSKKPCLLARSRGGLMLYNWAAGNPNKVGGIAGIYPVTNLESYPGLARACGAYKMTAGELKKGLNEHNPIERLQLLAEARVPIFHIQGDSDTVVPHEENSALLAGRYRKFGGTVAVELIKGQGHNMWRGWFESERLTDFAIARALGKDAEGKSESIKVD
jgi:predicted TIM-barrel fold metal-dependent hydrolase